MNWQKKYKKDSQIKGTNMDIYEIMNEMGLKKMIGCQNFFDISSLNSDDIEYFSETSFFKLFLFL